VPEFARFEAAAFIRTNCADIARAEASNSVIGRGVEDISSYSPFSARVTVWTRSCSMLSVAS
jgi:hypothetical protein